MPGKRKINAIVLTGAVRQYPDWFPGVTVRLQRAIAIHAVIAWRISVMSLLGGEVPKGKPDLMFSESECHFLDHYAREQGMDPSHTLGAAVARVAHLAGFRGQSPAADHPTRWPGPHRLSSAVIGNPIGFEAGQRPVLQPAGAA